MANKSLHKPLRMENLRSLIEQLLPTCKPNIEKAALKLGISSRTLQRRLAEMNLSYSQLIGEVRFLKARKLLIKHKTFNDIAIKLGYTGAGSLTRAFERWTGMSP